MVNPVAEGGERNGFGTGDLGEEEGTAHTGRDPRLVLLWEWQCPVPASLTLSTRVTCMAWNKVLQHLEWCTACRSCRDNP